MSPILNKYRKNLQRNRHYQINPASQSICLNTFTLRLLPLSIFVIYKNSAGRAVKDSIPDIFSQIWFHSSSARFEWE